MAKRLYRVQYRYTREDDARAGGTAWHWATGPGQAERVVREGLEKLRGVRDLDIRAIELEPDEHAEVSDDGK